MQTEIKAFEDLRQAHATLLRDLHGLEWMANAPSGATREELRQRLRAIRGDVANHFMLEEQDVYVNPVLKMEPTWDRKARELLSEHRSLLHSLDELIAASVEGARSAVDLREQVKHWVDQVRQHEIRENELFDQAGEEDPCCRRD